LDRNLSAFSTLFAPGKSWDNVRSTAAPYTESRLTRSVANERVGFPVVEQLVPKNFKIKIKILKHTAGWPNNKTSAMVQLQGQIYSGRTFPLNFLL
jgi:hypothetical protein